MNLALSAPQPKMAMLALALGHGQRVMKKTSPTSGLYPRLGDSSQGSPETFASHFKASWTKSPLELEALSKWA